MQHLVTCNLGINPVRYSHTIHNTDYNVELESELVKRHFYQNARLVISISILKGQGAIYRGSECNQSDISRLYTVCDCS